MASSWGNLPLLADTSAWVRNRRPKVREAWEEAAGDRRIVTAPPVVFELLYAARDGEDFDRVAQCVDRLHVLRLTQCALSAARAAMRELAHAGPGAHRVPQPDLLIAAIAQEAGAAVLHYDHHYDRLSEILGFASIWMAPPGSLD